MAKISLKNILSKDADAIQIVGSLSKQLNADFCIEDNNGKIILSNMVETGHDLSLPCLTE